MSNTASASTVARGASAPARPPTSVQPAPSARPRLGFTVALACLGVFIAYLPLAAVQVSLSTIGRALGASTADLQWISDAYTIPMAALILSCGVFGDIYGRKRVYLVGLALVAVGGAVSLAAGSAHLLWAGQAIIGAGAAALLPSTLALISHAIPNPARRGAFISLWASALVLGLVVGPLVAGTMLRYADWRWIFLPVIPVAALGALGGAILLDESKAPAGRRLDWPGQAAAALGIVALIYALIEGGEAGWTSAVSIGGFVVAALALAAFVVVEARGASPLLRVDLFRSPAFDAASVVAVLAQSGLVGTNFVLSLFFGVVQHLTPLEIAYRFTVLNGVTVVVGPLAGRVLTKVGPRWPLTVGLILVAAGFFGLAGLDPTTGLDGVWPPLALLGIGFGLVLTAVPTAAVNAVPHALAGMAGAANNTFRQLGGSLGPAILGVVLVGRAASALPGHLAAARLSPTERHAILARIGRDGLSAAGALRLGPDTGRALAAVGASFADGLHACVVLSGGAMLAAAALCMLLLRSRPHGETRGPE